MILTLSELFQKSALRSYIKIQNKSGNSKFESISVKINHPLFEFSSSSMQQGSCVIDLGDLEFLKSPEDLVLNLCGSTIYTLVHGSEEVLKDMILDDFNIYISAEMPNVQCKIPSILLASSMQQVNFLIKIFWDYKDQFAYISKYLKKNRENIEENEAKNEISETLAHGFVGEVEDLNLVVELDKACLAWTIISNSEETGKETVKLEGYFKDVLCQIVDKKQTTWVKLVVNQCLVECICLETLQILLPQKETLATIGLQILPARNIIDVSFNYPRFVITPKSLQALMLLVQEISAVVGKSKKKTENIINGEVKNLQIIVTSDASMVMDDEHFQSPMDSEQKRFCMLQVSAVFQDSCIKSEELFILIGKSSQFTDEIHGKYLLYPLMFQISKDEEMNIRISEINIDFSLNQVPFFTELYKKFKCAFVSDQESQELKKFPVNLQVQQILLGISHDFTISRNSSNNYFIIQLDYPSLHHKELTEFTTSLAIFYYNQQFFGWEPFIEKSEVSFRYSQQGNLKKLEVNSTDQINFNISSALIFTCTNFWKGIQQHKLLENIISSSPRQFTRIYSGFAIKNETGQKLRYWIEGKMSYLSNWEEHSLDFEEIQFEQEAPVIIFKNNMKTRKAYRIKTISIRIGDLAKIHDICIDKLGCKLYNISQQGSHYQVICEVSSRHGDNLLTIRSPIQLKNMLKEPLDIRLIYSLAQNKLNEEDYSSTISLPPMSTVPLHIERSHFTEFQLKIKGYGWSVRKGINHPEPLVIECPHKPMNSFELSNSRRRINSDDCKIAYAVFKLTQLELRDENEKFNMKVYTFESPFIIENCLCCDVEYFSRMLDSEIKAHGLLSRGDNFNCLEISPHASISLALRIPGYDWTSSLEILEESKHVFQFSKKYSEQVNIVVEASKKEGIFKLVLFSQYWLENHTGLPLLFKYMENQFNYDIISLPYVIEGVYIEERIDKKKSSMSSMFSAFGETLEFEEESIKPWMRYKEDRKLGLGSLLGDEEATDEGQGTIRMFSSDVSNPVQGMVSIKLASSQWSKTFKLIGNEGKKDLLAVSGHSIQAFEEASNSKRSCIYEVAMSMQIGEEPFSRTKIIRFTPRFVMVNKMPSAMLISQFEPNLDLEGVCRLMPNERSAYHWSDLQKSRAICIRLEPHGWQWSGQFYIEGPEDFVVRIRNTYTHEEILAHITITLEESTLHIIFQDTSYMPPYRIENLSMETISIQQYDSKIPEKILKPFEVCGYAWDLPLSKKLLKVSLHGESSSSCISIGKFKLESQEDLKKIVLKPHGSHPSHPIYVEVANSGSTKVLIFRHDMNEEDDIRHNREVGANDACLVLDLGYIGISLVNSSPEEIIYVSLVDVHCQFDRRCSDLAGDFSIKSGQIDNQLSKVMSPVLLSMIENNGMLIRVEFKKRQNIVIYI